MRRKFVDFLRGLFKVVFKAVIELEGLREDHSSKAANQEAILRASRERELIREHTIFPNCDEVTIDINEHQNTIYTTLLGGEIHPKVHVRIDPACRKLSLASQTNLGKVVVVDLDRFYFDFPQNNPIVFSILGVMAVKPPSRPWNFVDEFTWIEPLSCSTVLMEQISSLLPYFENMTKVNLHSYDFSLFNHKFTNCINRLNSIMVRVYSNVAKREDVEAFARALKPEHSFYFKSGKSREYEHYLGGFHYFIYQDGNWSEEYEPPAK